MIFYSFTITYFSIHLMSFIPFFIIQISNSCEYVPSNAIFTLSFKIMTIWYFLYEGVTLKLDNESITSEPCEVLGTRSKMLSHFNIFTAMSIRNNDSNIIVL